LKKLLFTLIAIGLVAGIGTAIFKNHDGKSNQLSDTQPPPVVPVDVVRPSKDRLSRVVEVFGSLTPKSETLIKSELPGLVQSLRVKDWDEVKPKDVLLEMDPTDLKHILSRNEAGLKMARAQLMQAKVDLNRARREWNRALKLKEGGLITGQELDERKTAQESAEAHVALAEAQVGQAEAQVAEARHNLSKAVICAPIQGTVCERRVDVGDWVDKGTALFSVVDNRILEFTANVSSIDLSLVCEGQTLTFAVDGLAGRTFSGRIKRVNPMVSSTDRTGRVIAEVENSDGALRGGLFARGRILIEERKDVMVLPKTALSGWDLEKGTARVFVVDNDSTARTRTVMTGLDSGDRIEIKSGLSETERVVLRGGFNLREGDKTRPIDQEAGR
jgi:membrane fusion protein, multidrug efflux system